MDRWGCKQIAVEIGKIAVEVLENMKNHGKITAFKYDVCRLQSHCVNAL